MSRTASERFEFDYVIHPGEILDDVVVSRGISRAELARRCELSEHDIDQIIEHHASVPPYIAAKFERELGIPADVWNRLDTRYRTHKEAWSRRFPLAALVKRGYLPKRQMSAERADALLGFFSLGSVEEWEDGFSSAAVHWAKSPAFESSFESLTAWLRIGEMEAEHISTSPYIPDRFRECLQDIKKLTVEAPEVFVPRMRELCRRSGLALVLVSELPKTHLSGAARWLASDRPLIMLSLRHKRDDHFWFSFFHESAHVLLHRSEVKTTIDDRREGESRVSLNPAELEADRFALDFLIPRREYERFTRSRERYSKQAVVDFATIINVAPGIVVGRLQHDGKIPYSHLNGLRRLLCLTEHGGQRHRAAETRRLSTA